jgi:staphylococcal nuclease domain-containing protein 1
LSVTRLAKEKRLRIWKSYTAKSTVAEGTEKDFDGVVTRIWSGDTVLVTSNKTGKEYKITLSSIRQPRYLFLSKCVF